MRIKIKVTKDILKRAQYCGTAGYTPAITNCAIALAVRDVFPDISVSHSGILFANGAMAYHTPETGAFIWKFDMSQSGQRPFLPEYEFEIDVPESVVDSINIDDLNNCPTLELVTN